MRSSVQRIVVLLAGVIGATPAAALAQDTRDTVRLKELVVTATRVPTPRASVAASVTVVSGDELRTRGVHQVLDALRSVAGVSIAQVGSIGGIASIFLRGGESDYVSVLVDGVPLNQPGGAVDLAHLTTDNIDRIEVVRGPASVLYGSDAVTGVVQVFTRRTRGAPRAELSVRGGAFQSVRLGVPGPVWGERTNGALEWQARVSGGTEQVGYAFGLSRVATEGLYTTNGTRSFNNDYRNTVVSGQVRAVPDARTEAVLSVRYGDDTYHFPTDGGGQIADGNAFQSQRSTALSLDLGRFLSDRVEARVLLTNHVTDGGTDDQPDDAADTLGFYGSESHATVERRQAEGRVIAHLPGGAAVTLGAQFEDQRQRGFSAFFSEFGTFSSDDDHRREGRAYYAQAQSDVLGAITVNGGVRLEDNETFGTHWTVRGGIVYRPLAGLRVRAAAGTGFKQPTFFENFATGFARGNPDLEPERSVSAELGVEQTVGGGRGLLAVTGFAQRFRDLIQFTFSPPSPTDPNFFNVAVADASGVELEARLAATASVSLNASYTYLRTRVIDEGFDTGPGATFVKEARLLRRPSHSAAVGVDFRPVDRARLHVQGRYVGDRDDRDFAAFPAEAVVLPAYATFDLAGEIDLVRGTPSATLTFRLENLSGADVQEAFGFPSRGETVWVGARVSF